MDSFIKSIYIGEIETQCDFALDAVGSLNSVLQALNDAHTIPFHQQERLHREVFRSIHSFLTHASNVSRLLWPTPPKRRKNEGEEQYASRCGKLKRIRRAIELREALSIPDNNHVLKSRTLRDHLEHFDERLDHWEETSSHHNYVQDIIGPPNAVAGTAETDMMRWFDPSTNNFRFRGETFDLQEIATAIGHLRSVAARAAKEARAW